MSDPRANLGEHLTARSLSGTAVTGLSGGADFVGFVRQDWFLGLRFRV